MIKILKKGIIGTRPGLTRPSIASNLNVDAKIRKLGGDFEVAQKSTNGITLIALIITIVVLLILASITVATITGDNGLISMVRNAKELSGIDSEKETVEISAIQAMQSDKFGMIKEVMLQDKMDKNAGSGIAKVEEQVGTDTFLVTYLTPQRIYQVDSDGNVEYLGKGDEVLDKTQIIASPESNSTPLLFQKVKLTVNTVISVADDQMTLIYAWSSDPNQEPLEENYVNAATLTGTGTSKEAEVASNDTEAGNYYLWVKVLIGEREISKTFGPYAIKEHKTLVSAASETSATSKFLGSPDIVRNQIESVKIETSKTDKNGVTHTVNGSTCWDVSQSKDETYIAWYEDADENGYYEVTIAGEGGVVANTNSSYLFANIGYNGEDTTVIYGIENLDTGFVTSMKCMFNNCINMTTLNLTTFNTNNVTTLFATFQGCTNLKTLNVSNWDTSKVTEMGEQYGYYGYGGTFQGCSSLTSLDISNWDTSNVVGMGNMFNGCKSLTNLDVSNFDTSNVISMYAMFADCNNLNSVYMSKSNTKNLLYINRMFMNCKNLIYLDIDNLNTSNVTNMSYMFYGCSSATNIDVSNFDTSNVTNMASMFNGCSSATNIDVSNFNTGNVTNMSEMFRGCSSATNIDVSNFNTNNVTNMSCMFYGCRSITNIDVSNFNTSNVMNMSNMFMYCSNLISLNLSNFITDKLENITYIFYGCKNLAEINLNKFNPENITNNDHIFILVPTTVTITTNQTMADWIIEKFPTYKDCITVVSQ